MIWWILVGVLSAVCAGLLGLLIWILVQFSHFMDGF